MDIWNDDILLSDRNRSNDLLHSLLGFQYSGILFLYRYHHYHSVNINESEVHLSCLNFVVWRLPNIIRRVALKHLSVKVNCVSVFNHVFSRKRNLHDTLMRKLELKCWCYHLSVVFHWGGMKMPNLINIFTGN